MEIILVFESTNDAIHAEQLLVKNGFYVGVMNLPYEIKAGCGICLRLKPDDAQAAQDLLQQNAYPYHSVYQRKQVYGTSQYMFLSNGETLK